MKGARATARAVPRRRGAARATVDARRRVRSNPRAVRAVEESARALNEWLGRPRIPAGVDRGDIAERMLPIAAALSCITHGDGGAADVEYVLGRLAPGEWPALVTVLAGMVDPDARLVDVFGYITWDENERPLRDMPMMAGTVRDIQAKWETPSGVTDVFLAERINQIREYVLEQGHSITQTAREWGHEKKTISAWVKGRAA